MSNSSWLSPVERLLDSPYVLGPGYSQFRKVHLCLKLVRDSDVKYSIVIRSRPDHMIITPIDLRHFAREFAERPSVRAARGHFWACPERSEGQVLTDHFAMGTMDAMLAYGERPLPYTQVCSL